MTLLLFLLFFLGVALGYLFFIYFLELRVEKMIALMSVHKFYDPKLIYLARTKFWVSLPDLIKIYRR